VNDPRSKKLLFLCSQNRLRSPTAEAIFCDLPGIEVDSAGLDRGAEVVLSAEQIEWADLIFVMEKAHRKRLNEKYGKFLAGKEIVVLGIPDDYECMDPVLVDLLKEKCARYLR
jgi:predicted protein tyrosine phosphatase